MLQRRRSFRRWILFYCFNNRFALFNVFWHVVKAKGTTKFAVFQNTASRRNEVQVFPQRTGLHSETRSRNNCLSFWAVLNSSTSSNNRAAGTEHENILTMSETRHGLCQNPKHAILPDKVSNPLKASWKQGICLAYQCSVSLLAVSTCNFVEDWASISQLPRAFVSIVTCFWLRAVTLQLMKRAITCIWLPRAMRWENYTSHRACLSSSNLDACG